MLRKVHKTQSTEFTVPVYTQKTKNTKKKREASRRLSKNARFAFINLKSGLLWFSMQHHPSRPCFNKQPKPRRSNKKTKTTREEQRTTNGTNNAFKFNFSPAMKLQHSFFASAAALLVNSPLAHSLSTAAMSTEKITK